jgi:hypothetical protein
MDSIQIVRKFYDETVNYEWKRLDRHKVEYEISRRFMARYIIESCIADIFRSCVCRWCQHWYYPSLL